MGMNFFPYEASLAQFQWFITISTKSIAEQNFRAAARHITTACPQNLIKLPVPKFVAIYHFKALKYLQHVN
jgi:hypothetical protein